MTREEADFIGSMNMCDEISNEAYKKIMCHCEEQEPCEDAISREQLERELHAQMAVDAISKEVALDMLEHLPPVTPQPKTGHWIRWYEQKENDGCIEHIPHCKCSECGKEYDPFSSQFVKYCNECGAKMAESEEQA